MYKADKYKTIKNDIRDYIDISYFRKWKFSRRIVKVILAIYFKHMYRAVANGHVILVNKQSACIALEMEDVRALKKEEEKKYFKSNRYFGKMFYVSITRLPLSENWIFYPNEEFSRIIQETIDSDVIYELIKQ